MKPLQPELGMNLFLARGGVDQKKVGVHDLTCAKTSMKLGQVSVSTGRISAALTHGTLAI